MKTIKNAPAFTLIELVISATMFAVIIFAISSIVIFTTTTLSASDAERGLQMDMDLLASQIIDGVFEPAGFSHGLRDAVSYTIANPERVNFTDTAGVTRSFIASGSSGTLIYDSPTQDPAQTLIYTAPAGATLNVIFAYPVPLTNKLVNISMSVTKTINGKLLTGSVVTSVYLRNAH